ncbi:Sodium/hydrogen exchanger family-domain-containing protein [Gymnopilus junonius]|uniref:Sodium/hydrogen exchanger family-domain-containing protein n=1 Tax=Gymnopilus junonius TaxID=109634 RepID=A0A9P5NV37_GYMJU|nr:Sodium/hydrogen exchanger family-domain-containing protein [Gymnopilus junonius]
MAIVGFSISTPHIVYALLGSFSVLFSMFSLFLRERLYVSEAIGAFIFGVIIGASYQLPSLSCFHDSIILPGPYCAGILDPRSWTASSNNLITLEFTRIVLATGVFSIGVELPEAYMKKHWKSISFLLVPVMIWGWLVSAALVFSLIPGLHLSSSLVVAACLIPTDPVLTVAIVGGKWAEKYVPVYIRHLLAAESACNDGAAYPFLYLALYFTIDKTMGHAIKDWFLCIWLYQVILGCIIGCLLGFVFRHLMKFCQRHDLIDRNSYVAQYISLTMLTVGVTTLLGADDLLAAFFCGTVFAWDGFFNRQTEESVFSSVIDTLFNVAAFIYVGAWMPFDKFQDPQQILTVWRLLAVAILVLLLRRLPIVMILCKFIPDIKTFREAMFVGHFGPIGIRAVFTSILAIMALENARTSADDASTPQSLLLEQVVQPIVAFVVLCSIAVHGLSIPGFSFGRRMQSVSRTWSRRSTVTGAKLLERGNQARMVNRMEDVMVNRDSGLEVMDLEKGNLSILENDKEIEQIPESISGTTAAGNEHTIEEMEGSGLNDEAWVAGHSTPANNTRFVEGDIVTTAPTESPGSARE